MNYFISSVSAATYKKMVKPLLFRCKPDTVHSLAIRFGATIQQSRGLLHILKSIYSYSNPERLGQHIHGVYIENPVGLSAGFDKNIEIPAVMQAIGFGYMEGGTLTNQAYAGNVRPWFYRLPHSQSLVVHAGLANYGVDRILHVLSSVKKNQHSFPLNISVAHTNVQKQQSVAEMVQDSMRALRKIKRARAAQMITINISCPNTFNGEVFTKPGALGKLLDAVDRLKLSQPTFLKMPGDLSWKEFDALLKVAAEHRVAGVTICNLTKNRKRVSMDDTLPSSFEGGLSGKAVFELSNELIRKTYKAYGARFTIIGVGGMFTAADAYTKIRLGASLVEMVTGLIYGGPQVVGAINKGLVELLERDGLDTISRAIGVDAK